MSNDYHSSPTSGTFSVNVTDPCGGHVRHMEVGTVWYCMLQWYMELGIVLYCVVLYELDVVHGGRYFVVPCELYVVYGGT